MINKELKTYIEEQIFPCLKQKNETHQIGHIKEVIEKSMSLSKTQGIDQNMVYTIAAFHNIAGDKKASNPEISVKRLTKDAFLNQFFSKEQRNVMANVIQNQNTPGNIKEKNIYEQILFVARRLTTIPKLFQSTMLTYLESQKSFTSQEIFEACYNDIQKKYDSQERKKSSGLFLEYDQFLKQIEEYLKHPYNFQTLFNQVERQVRKEKHLAPSDFQREKRYYTVDEYLKNTFHQKICKLSLNGGFSCPNMQNGQGCIFCSNQSGDFAAPKEHDLKTQIQEMKRKMQKKWPDAKFIAYFQVGTNTYAPLSELKEKYETVLQEKDIVGLDIATRSDAISDETLRYLEDLNQRTHLTIELGLQSIHFQTLQFIHRGHTLENFEAMVKKLKERKIRVVVHIINGLPNETEEMMLQTVRYLNQLQIDGIKIHMLHILKNTPLAKYYQRKNFPILTKEEYIHIVCKQLELLNPNIVIHRLTGDPKKEDLIAPTWLLKKFVVLNDIDKALQIHDSYQGKLVR